MHFVVALEPEVQHQDLNHEEGFLLPSTPPLSNPIIENSLPTGAISKGLWMAPRSS
ncbi:unnamed protein product [Rangifer tarandus platyrhynchus]|uniref:Uncharacterized protein n=1 Tax=Rangifer tarandus platyrhynchus TaxID=3082113 RepID=A0ABN8ZDJ6_RANTA|nr:unnamed protein product [Rangifer tarandus platyrhynchus]